jgi:hypothetical protein
MFYFIGVKQEKMLQQNVACLIKSFNVLQIKFDVVKTKTLRYKTLFKLPIYEVV